MITTLPGTIPDLLRRGSPVLGDHKEVATVHEIDGKRYWCALTWDGPRITVWRVAADLALDLSDPTGRAHAARWVSTQPSNACWAAAAQVFTSGSRIAAMDAIMDAAIWQRDMTPEQIDLLARVVLVLAGRT